MDENTTRGAPDPGPPEGRQVTRDEAEVLLQSRMREKCAEFEQAVWELVRFYSTDRQQEVAANYLALLMSLTDDPERQAGYWLALGQLMEQVENFEAACDYYRRAFGMEPTQSDTWYFINNNLGYSLIQLGRFDEAEPYCRSAIQISPRRHNAYKNLGLALRGQGRHLEAAESFIHAVQANPADPRALVHLDALLLQHPEVAAGNPAILGLVPRCREAVALATGMAEAAREQRQARFPELTHAEKILVAANRLVFLEGAAEFSEDEIRGALGLSAGEWRSGYAPVFRAMQEGGTDGAPPLDRKHRGVFERARRGVHRLTPHGHEVVEGIHDL